MAYVELGRTAAFGGANGGTSANIDSTGASLALFFVGDNSGSAPPVSDSLTQTWLIAPPTRYSAFGVGAQCYVAILSATSATHNFTIGGTSVFAIGFVVLLSGSNASPLDQEAGTGFANQPGSITPSANNAIVFSAMAWSAPGVTVSSVTGMSNLSQNDATGTTTGLAIASVIQTTASAINPTWNYTGVPSVWAVGQWSFKASAAAPADTQEWLNRSRFDRKQQVQQSY